MNGILKVDTAVLQNKSSEFDTVRAQIMTIIEGMTSKVNALSTVWEGDASTEYRNKYSQLSDDIQYLNNLILEYVNDLNDIASTYNPIEPDLSAEIAGLPNDIIK